MERLTQYTSDEVAESYIGEADNINIYKGGMEGKYISGRQITKLAEYEDTGLTPQDVIIVQGLSKKYFDTGVKLMLENKYINKELEVYKRALKLAFENIQVDYDGYGYFVFNGEEHHYTLNEEDLVRECLKQARKELFMICKNCASNKIIKIDKKQNRTQYFCESCESVFTKKEDK